MDVHSVALTGPAGKKSLLCVPALHADLASLKFSNLLHLLLQIDTVEPWPFSMEQQFLTRLSREFLTQSLVPISTNQLLASWMASEFLAA